MRGRSIVFGPRAGVGGPSCLGRESGYDIYWHNALEARVADIRHCIVRQIDKQLGKTPLRRGVIAKDG